MKAKKLHTSVNLLMEPELYQDLRRVAKLQKISMSQIVRDGARLILAKIEKEDNAIIGGQE